MKRSVTTIATIILLLLTTALAYTYVNHPEKLPGTLGGVQTYASIGPFHSGMTYMEAREKFTFRRIDKEGNTSLYRVELSGMEWPIDSEPGAILLQFTFEEPYIGKLTSVLVLSSLPSDIEDAFNVFNKRIAHHTAERGEPHYRQGDVPKPLQDAIDRAKDPKEQFHYFWLSLQELWSVYAGWEASAAWEGAILMSLGADESDHTVYMAEVHLWNGREVDLSSLISNLEDF